MLYDKCRPVEHIFADPNLTLAGKFLELVEQAPYCICAADCRTLQYLWGELERMRSKDAAIQ
jgi:hypothetical protein